MPTRHARSLFPARRWLRRRSGRGRAWQRFAGDDPLGGPLATVSKALTGTAIELSAAQRLAPDQARLTATGPDGAAALRVVRPYAA